MYSSHGWRAAAICWALVRMTTLGNAQGPAPETAPPIFPGGALVSYGSVITARELLPGIAGNVFSTSRPTFSHEGNFNFTWGFRPNFDLSIVIPVITNHFPATDSGHVGGTGLGDPMLLVKYRFYRRDSARGTTQASVSMGPKFPFGRTDLEDTRGRIFASTLQPGSGSTDVFVGANWTYTGLFNLRRLVADEDFHALLRSQGSGLTRRGSEVESRFWLSYRPYESKNVAREWFVGPVVTWLHSQDDEIAGAAQTGSGGNLLLAGVANYVGLRPGMHVWLGMDWDAAHSLGAMFMPVRRHISFGITQQFHFHSLRGRTP